MKDGFDATYERMTTSDGKASFTPKAGNYYLVAAHKTDAAPAGETKYESIKYSATLTVYVPDRCPCCGE